MHRSTVPATVAVLLGALAATGCSSTRVQHGWVADAIEAAPVQAGVDTKATVRARLGSPSTESALEGGAWYYVSSEQTRFAFLTPETVERTVIAVRFNELDVVEAVEQFGLERGQIVSYSSDVTPTRGRELGILEQLFGNVGRGAPVGLGEEEGRRPGR